MSIHSFLQKVKQTPKEISFTETIAVIEENYDFTPTQFKIGPTLNEANQNNGSCKVFSFAQLNVFSKEETLALFGAFYREDVLGNPEGEDY